MDNGLVEKPSILDLGCGVGHGCFLLSKIPGSRIVGVDICQDSVDYAKEYYFADNIRYSVHDINHTIEKYINIDYVVSRGVLEHIQNGIRTVINDNKC